MACLVASTGARALAGCAAAIALAMSLAWPGVGRAAAEMAFDLPAQPLKAALSRYDAQTNMSVFYPSELAEGRTSRAVHGTLTPEQALHRLLQGTGLAARAAAGDAFVLVPSGEEPASSDAQGEPSARQPYDGLVQAHVRQALCARPALALGTYRLALAVQIDGAGRVRRARLLDTTGDRGRDAAIVQAVRQVDIGHAPAEPEKPFVLLVRPVQCEQGQACASPCEAQRDSR
ncbi:STN domain-containing protein [Cupriavidus sp. CP313]